MFDWLKERITEPLQEMIIESINNYFISLLASIVDGISHVLYKEAELVKLVFEHRYFSEATLMAQSIAISMLILRVAYQAFNQYILYSSGQQNSAGDLLKDTFFATAMIASVPWIVRTVYIFAINLTDDILKISPVTQIDTVKEAIMTILGGHVTLIFLNLMMLIGFCMIVIILLQIAARTVTIGLLMVVGPFLWAFKNEYGNEWFKAVMQNTLSLPVQMFLLRGALGMLAVTADRFFINIFLFIGFLWVAIKAPQFIQRWTTSTGVGSAIGGTAATATQFIILRRFLAK